jgi:phage gp36-like protein
MYATVAQFIEKFGEQEAIELSNIASWKSGNSKLEIKDTVIAGAIEVVGPEIDGYIGTRYQLPLPQPYPSLVTQLALDLARYRLDLLKPREDVIEAAKRAYKQLEQIAKGSLALVSADGRLCPTSGQNRSQSYGGTVVGEINKIEWSSSPHVKGRRY